MDSTIVVGIRPQKGNTMSGEKIPEGYVTVTETDTDGKVIYGVFPTQDKALAFGANLINCVVYPIYPPSLH